MPKNLNDIPSDYRHMFYPPVIQEMFHFSEPSEYDIFDVFKKTAKVREENLMALNVAFFTGEVRQKSELEILLSRFKYGCIIEGAHKYITYVDNETMKAYRLKDDSYYEGLLYPLQEVTEFTFDHWCSSMEL